MLRVISCSCGEKSTFDLYHCSSTNPPRCGGCGKVLLKVTQCSCGEKNSFPPNYVLNPASLPRCYRCDAVMDFVDGSSLETAKVEILPEISGGISPPLHTRVSFIILPILIFVWLSFTVRERNQILVSTASSHQIMVVFWPAVCGLLGSILTWNIRNFLIIFKTVGLVILLLLILLDGSSLFLGDFNYFNSSLFNMSVWMNFFLVVLIPLSFGSISFFLYQTYKATQKK